MSGLLTQIAEGFDLRMALRRRMLAHLEVLPPPDLPEDRVLALRPAIRATLKACGTCQNPDICSKWLDQRGEGPPPFCRGRGAFMTLREAMAKAGGGDPAVRH